MPSSLEAPLIANADDGRDEELRPYDSDGESHGGPDPGRPADYGAPGSFVWLLTFAAGISGVLFGCRHIPAPATPPGLTV